MCIYFAGSQTEEGVPVSKTRSESDWGLAGGWDTVKRGSVGCAGNNGWCSRWAGKNGSSSRRVTTVVGVNITGMFLSGSIRSCILVTRNIGRSSSGRAISCRWGGSSALVTRDIDPRRVGSGWYDCWNAGASFVVGNEVGGSWESRCCYIEQLTGWHAIEKSKEEGLARSG